MDIGTPSGPGIDTVPVSSLYAQCREGSSPTTTLPSTPVRVPNVVGMTSTQAGNALAKLHLAMDVGLTQVTSADRVASQAPTAGALVEPGTVVAVRVSAS
jgi:beta-lactam-binding protein with PASTA domain